MNKKAEPESGKTAPVTKQKQRGQGGHCVTRRVRRAFSSGQIRCQSSGRRSLRVTFPSVAFSMATQLAAPGRRPEYPCRH